MKFTVTKSGAMVSLAVEDEHKARRLYEIAVNGRVFVKGKPPKMSKLRQTMETHRLEGGMSASNFLDVYCMSQQDIIERETKELLQCLMRIQNASDCIDLAEDIRFGDSEE